MDSLILAIIAFIVVVVLCRIIISEFKRGLGTIILIVLWSTVLGSALNDYINSSKSQKPKATEVYKDKVTLKTDSIIVFLK